MCRRHPNRLVETVSFSVVFYMRRSCSRLAADALEDAPYTAPTPSADPSLKEEGVSEQSSLLIERRHDICGLIGVTSYEALHNRVEIAIGPIARLSAVLGTAS
jgi:hypothetical protein